MDFILLFWEIFINMLENSIYTFLFFSSLKLQRRYKKHIKIVFFAITLTETILTCICNFSQLSSITTQLLLLGGDFFLIFVLFQDKLPKKIFTVTLPSCISILADKLTLFIGSFLFPTTLKTFYFYGNLRFYSTIMYLIICLLSSLLFIRLTKSDIYLTAPLCFATYCIIILGIICSNLFLDIIAETEQDSIPHGTMVRFQFISAGFIMIFLFLIFLIQQIGNTYENNLKLEMKLHQEQVNQTQLELSMQSMQNIQSWKHDYKNHMVTMTALAKEESYTELRDYLKKLQESLPEYFTSISSGNTAIDAIVTNKLQLAKQAGIQFTYSIMLAGICPLSDIEITAILGNLLDNSLEACRKILKQPHELSPNIHLSIKPFRDMLQIQITNSSDGNYKIAKDNVLQSTKKDSNLHGYGIRHVQEIVKEANGIIKFWPEQKHFKVNILLPFSEREV